MKNTNILIRLIPALAAAGVLAGGDMVIRVYTGDWQDLVPLVKQGLDVASASPGRSFDIVGDAAVYDRIRRRGLACEVTVADLEYEKEKNRGAYLDYAQINDSLRALAGNHPTICRLDSLPYPTYEGRRIYGVKISDNVMLEETEPGFTLDGCHHSREWATPQACLFFADSLLRSYGSSPVLTEIVNTTQIFVFPVINVDGYVYDWVHYQGGWRLNRQPFGGAIGNDPNRNYGGACSGELIGDWGAVDEGQACHEPGNEIFCGSRSFSGREVDAYARYIVEHAIVSGISLHSYGEQVMWPWGYKPGGAPDAALYTQKGNYIAGLMLRQGGGTYTPGQSYFNPYPTSGNARDWVYGYNHYVSGRSSLFYGSETGLAFYPPAADLDFISRQVFKAAAYLAGFSDSLVLVTDGTVPAPVIHALDTVGQDFSVSWQARNSYDNNPLHWELAELSGPVIIEDNLESGAGRWLLDGFTLTTAQAHSGSRSLWSGSGADRNAGVRSVHPYPVAVGDSVTFWCRYDLENNFDVAVAEVSENTREWFSLDTARFTGLQTGWIRKAYSLAAWQGRSVFLRFRCMTDGSVHHAGFYVDDIKPSCVFDSIRIVSSAIDDTLYQFAGHALGDFYYQCRGFNAAWGWGDYSCLEHATVTTAGSAEKAANAAAAAGPLSIAPVPARRVLFIECSPPAGQGVNVRIFNAGGIVVEEFTRPAGFKCRWTGNGRCGRLPAGVYFVEADWGTGRQVLPFTWIR